MLKSLLTENEIAAIRELLAATKPSDTPGSTADAVRLSEDEERGQFEEELSKIADGLLDSIRGGHLKTKRAVTREVSIAANYRYYGRSEHGVAVTLKCVDPAMRSFLAQIAIARMLMRSLRAQPAYAQLPNRGPVPVATKPPAPKSVAPALKRVMTTHGTLPYAKLGAILRAPNADKFDERNLRQIESLDHWILTKTQKYTSDRGRQYVQHLLEGVLNAGAVRVAVDSEGEVYSIDILPRPGSLDKSAKHTVGNSTLCALATSLIANFDRDGTRAMLAYWLAEAATRHPALMLGGARNRLDKALSLGTKPSKTPTASLEALLKQAGIALNFTDLTMLRKNYKDSQYAVLTVYTESTPTNWRLKLTAFWLAWTHSKMHGMVPVPHPSRTFRVLSFNQKTGRLLADITVAPLTKESNAEEDPDEFSDRF